MLNPRGLIELVILSELQIRDPANRNVWNSQRCKNLIVEFDATEENFMNSTQKVT